MGHPRSRGFAGDWIRRCGRRSQALLISGGRLLSSWTEQACAGLVLAPCSIFGVGHTDPVNATVSVLQAPSFPSGVLSSMLPSALAVAARLDPFLANLPCLGRLRFAWPAPIHITLSILHPALLVLPPLLSIPRPAAAVQLAAAIDNTRTRTHSPTPSTRRRGPSLVTPAEKDDEPLARVPPLSSLSGTDGVLLRLGVFHSLALR